jgi:formate hydrogenlyase subunit 4
VTRKRSLEAWLAVVLFGLAYLVVGVFFPNPSAADRNQFVWRFAAWVICAAAFAIHIAIERFRFRNSAGSTALHVAIAVAVGGFGLAVAANVHALRTGTGNRVLLALALGLWPVITGVPAFLVAFVIAALLSWLKRDDPSSV